MENDERSGRGGRRRDEYPASTSCIHSRARMRTEFEVRIRFSYIESNAEVEARRRVNIEVACSNEGRKTRWSAYIIKTEVLPFLRCADVNPPECFPRG